jgi:hypothetical protein
MWRRIPAVQSVSAIGVVLLNIASWIPPVQDWVSKTWPFIDSRWINLIFFIIFVIVIYWIIHDLYKNIEESENKKPSISVDVCMVNNDFNLEITNNGEKGVFEAELVIIRARGSSVGEKYYPVWGKSNTNKSEILHGHSDIIKIASVRLTDPDKIFELYAYDITNSTICTVRSIKYDKMLINGTMPNFIIQVNISSDPSLKERNYIEAYDITPNQISPIKAQRILTTYPAELETILNH